MVHGEKIIGCSSADKNGPCHGCGGGWNDWASTDVLTKAVCSGKLTEKGVERLDKAHIPICGNVMRSLRMAVNGHNGNGNHE